MRNHLALPFSRLIASLRSVRILRTPPEAIPYLGRCFVEFGIKVQIIVAAGLLSGCSRFGGLEHVLHFETRFLNRNEHAA